MFVAEEIKSSIDRGRSLKSHGVLFRSASHSIMLELELTRRNIPFKKFGGTAFTESAHIRDLLAVLRYAENPSDRVAAMRVLILLPGVGRGTAIQMLNNGACSTDLSKVSAPRAAAEAWQGLRKFLDALRGEKLGWPHDLEAARKWYQPYFKTEYPDHAKRSEDLDHLQTIAGSFKSRQRFLTDLTMDPPSKRDAASPKGDNDYVSLSTIHSAKGREWRNVFVLNVIDGCIPSSRARSSAEIEEERRLLYVAMTRAKRELTLTMPQMRAAGYGYGNELSSRSPFLPESVLECFDRLTWQTVTENDALDADNDDTPFDLPARIRARSKG